MSTHRMIMMKIKSSSHMERNERVNTHTHTHRERERAFASVETMRTYIEEDPICVDVLLINAKDRRDGLDHLPVSYSVHDTKLI